MPDQPAGSAANRRGFFRLFAGDVATSVGSLLGAAQLLQQESADAARELLGVDRPTGSAPTPSGASEPASAPAWDASAAGYRAPLRWDGETAYLVDQRQLPDILAEFKVERAADAIDAMTGGAIHGSAVQAQLAAVTLAITASRAQLARPFARKAIIRGAASSFRLTRPGSAAIALATDRFTALLDELGIDAMGSDIAEAFRLEAEAIIAEATNDHGLIAGHVPAALPGGPETPIHVLTTGSTGAMGSGHFGTALGAIMALHHAGRPIHALVAETRPVFIGARIAAWELQQAGVPHAVVTDAAAPGTIASGEVEAVLVSADRIAANGDVIAVAGTYALALAAAAEGIPFIVCAATTTVDPDAPDGDGATIEEAPPAQVLTVHGRRIALEGTQIRNPVQDLVQASLVTAIVTEEGVLRAPYGPAIAAALEAADERRSSARGYAALIARRAAAAAEPTAAEPAAAEAASAGATAAAEPVPPPGADAQA